MASAGKRTHSRRSSGSGGGGNGSRRGGTAVASRESATRSPGKGKAKPKRKRGWNYPRKGLGPIHRWLPSWRVLLGAFVTGVAVVVGLFVAAYATTDIPEPDDMALAEGSTVYFADGSTEMGTLAEVNREIVDTTELPDYVGQAVVASEDRRFYSNSGIDPIGIARALWNNLQGGQQQGGSTLTQQYVERYYLGTTTDYIGKFREAIIAIKLDRELDKSEILDAYLNTIYFGRNAYGIDAAAQAYFGKPAAELTVSESALLAGIIPSPNNWDPAVSPEQAEARWSRVLGFMAEDGWITEEERAAATFPTTIEYQRSDTFAGPNGYLLQMAIDELTTGDDAPYTVEELNRQGLSITTTIDPTMQQAAVDTMQNMPEGHAENLRGTLVSVDPATGGIRALYGGADYITESYNRATQAVYQGGSTFKPFTLVAALEQGLTLEDRYESYSPREFENDYIVRNFDRRNRGNIDLVEATANSVNTVYVQLNEEVGPEATVDVAVRAGLPEDTNGLEAVPSNVLGSAAPHAVDMATAYATFAAQGERHTTHIVAEVTDQGGNVAYTADTSGEGVFDAAVMADATYAMTQVVEGGTGETASALDRPVAGKTGSSNDYRSASFAGYIPQLATVVALYQTADDGTMETLTPFGGYDPVAGGTVPADLWTQYMQVATQGMEVQEFPERSAPATPPPPELVQVPDVVGLDEAGATARLAEVGLVASITQEPSTSPEGTVVHTDPGAGTEVPEGTSVAVVISSGEPEPTEDPTTPEPTEDPTEEPTEDEEVEVPDTTGQQATAAQIQLSLAGFAVSQVEEASADVPAGFVIRQDPAGGTAPSGSTVTIVVSTGPSEEDAGEG